MKVAQLHLTLQPHGLYSPWNSPGQNTRVGGLSLLQGIFPTQGLNPGLLHCRQILYRLIHKASLRTLEWVAYLFSRGSSQPRNQTGVSCIAGGFFTSWALSSLTSDLARSPALEAWSLNHWTTREVPTSGSYLVKLNTWPWGGGEAWGDVGMFLKPFQELLTCHSGRF